ncbi:unnamed protein product [Prorocentrum cordatum]|uniref:Secreted protein n=1 Tax=Prorocentrum cordatum TaxID=2364126 RepID=A0ABN9XIZ8_9DINO|nr:unnamed protein product [Polarella glacialis]
MEVYTVVIVVFLLVRMLMEAQVVLLVGLPVDLQVDATVLMTPCRPLRPAEMLVEKTATTWTFPRFLLSRPAPSLAQGSYKYVHAQAVHGCYSDGLFRCARHVFWQARCLEQPPARILSPSSASSANPASQSPAHARRNFAEVAAQQRLRRTSSRRSGPKAPGPRQGRNQTRR